ncbi:hypothetical protein HYY75_07905 [bacterium]|nr:hypothetical protein [bacterium]
MKRHKTTFLLAFLFIFAFCVALFSQTQKFNQRYILVVPTDSAIKIIRQSTNLLHSYSVLGDQTVLIGGNFLLDYLNKEKIFSSSTQIKENQEPWLITTKDPTFNLKIFPDVQVILKVFGFWVVLANETTKMGMGSKMSDFSRIDPLPRNSTILTPTRLPLKKTDEYCGRTS